MRSKKVTPTKTELYFYTGNKLSYITDGAKKLKYYFVRDLSGKLLQMLDYTGATPKAYIYILDIHGNVIGLSDDTGILVNYEYDAWGNIINIPQSAPVTGNGEPLVSANPFRYCGYQFDGETGFYYLKYRYYYPVIGRFLTKDPMISYNRYMYCSNNPVNFVDSLGLAQAYLEGDIVVIKRKRHRGGASGTFTMNDNSINSGITAEGSITNVQGPYAIVGTWEYNTTGGETRGFGASAGSASWEMIHAQGDYTYGGAGFGAIKAEAEATADIREGIAVGTMASLINGEVYGKIPIPFTDYSLKIGGEGYLFGAGADAKLTWGKKKEIKLGLSALVGASVTLGLEERK